MIVAPFYHIESVVSLLIVLGALILSVLASVIFPDKEQISKEANEDA